MPKLIKAKEDDQKGKCTMKAKISGNKKQKAELV